MANIYVGDIITLSVEIRNAANTLINPSVISLRIKSPAGAVYDFASGVITAVSTGIYSMDYQPLESGTYTCRFKGTGANAGIGIDKFVIFDDPLD